MPSGFQLAQHQATAYETFTRVFMEGSARLLAEGALIHAGDVVLDLACGTGLVARHAAALVSPDGRLVGADINPAMLEIARGSIEAGVEWVESPSDALPFDDDTFTHVICQQGFQFFPDPVAAMRETRRVLQPCGVLIATVWATPGQNPYIENQLDLLAELEPSLATSVQRATPANADDFLRLHRPDGRLPRHRDHDARTRRRHRRLRTLVPRPDRRDPVGPDPRRADRCRTTGTRRRR